MTKEEELAVKKIMFPEKKGGKQVMGYERIQKHGENAVTRFFLEDNTTVTEKDDGTAAGWPDV